MENPGEGFEEPQSQSLPPEVEVESNDYKIELSFDIDGKLDRAEIRYVDGVPETVQFNWGPPIPAALVRQVQNALMQGMGQSFRQQPLPDGLVGPMSQYQAALGHAGLAGRFRSPKGPNLGY